MSETAVTDETTTDEVESETRDVGFVYAHGLDPARKLPHTSLYLDEVERHNAEKTRAVIEDRDPDYDNPPSTQGTPLYSVEVIERTLPQQAKLEPDVTLPVSVVVGDGEYTGTAAVPSNVSDTDTSNSDAPADDPFDFS